MTQIMWSRRGLRGIEIGSNSKDFFTHITPVITAAYALQGVEVLHDLGYFTGEGWSRAISLIRPAAPSCDVNGALGSIDRFEETKGLIVLISHHLRPVSSQNAFVIAR